MTTIANWAETVAERMLANYEECKRIGWTDRDARGWVLENSCAGPKAKAIFIRKVAPMACQFCGVETIDVRKREDGRQLCDWCL